MGNGYGNSMMRQKFRLYLFVLTTTSIVISCNIHLSFAQNKNVYFKFILDSKETYHKESGLRPAENELLYQKHKPGNKTTIFLIKGLMFVHNSSKMEQKIVNERDSLSLSDLLSADETEQYIRDLQEEYPFGYKYSTNSHPKMFIAVPGENKNIRLYEVRWQYYIECVV